MSEPDQFYLSKEEPVRSCLLALRDIILKQDPNVNETRKWGMPCFCFRKKMFCYLWTDKKTGQPYLLFVEGKHLEHPLLEVGSRARMKVFPVNAAEDIPVDTIVELLNTALDLYRSGKIKA